MKRQERFENTNTFFFENVNPKNRITADCVARALSNAMGKQYNDVVIDLANITIKTGYAGHSKEGFGKYLEQNGWIKMPQPKHNNGTKYTGEEFVEWLNSYSMKQRLDKGHVIAKIGSHHITAIILEKDGYRIHDIWDCSNVCIGNYWIRKEK